MGKWIDTSSFRGLCRHRQAGICRFPGRDLKLCLGSKLGLVPPCTGHCRSVSGMCSWVYGTHRDSLVKVSGKTLFCRPLGCGFSWLAQSWGQRPPTWVWLQPCVSCIPLAGQGQALKGFMKRRNCDLASARLSSPPTSRPRCPFPKAHPTWHAPRQFLLHFSLFTGPPLTKGRCVWRQGLQKLQCRLVAESCAASGSQSSGGQSHLDAVKLPEQPPNQQLLSLAGSFL